ncbi:DUF2029 domain-containing protein [Frankia sp. CN6]|uniref:DUF2029 domain-containing protein n=1 Tax=Frankia nepalensis TaxID=1836974 RepID=A0A937RIA4_9ACTN|nr:DUF2029 domain-containing protein [Frankia nepalensis]
MGWARRLGRLVPAGWPVHGVPVVGALLVANWLVYVDPQAHYDVNVFLRAGDAVLGGRDPYPTPGTEEVYSGSAFVYPYLMAVLFVPLALLPSGGPELFVGLSTLAVLAGCGLAGARSWRVYALVPVASCAITGLQHGTLSPLLFAGSAMLWRLRDQPVPAGLVAALLAYSKLFLLPVALWLLVTGRYRATATCGAALVVLFAVTELVSPVGLGTYVGMLDALAREEAPDGLALTGLLLNAGLGPAASWAARAVAGGLLVACLLRSARPTAAPGGDDDGRDGPGGAAASWPGDERLMFAATVAAALLASPIVWSHYLLLLAAPLLVLNPGGDAAAAVATIASWLLVTPHLTTAARLAVTVAVLAALTAEPLAATTRGVASSRPSWRALAVGAGAVLATAAGWAAFWAASRARAAEGRVTGAHLTLLAALALLGWAAHRASGETYRSGTEKHGRPRRGPVGDPDHRGRAGQPVGD